MLLRILRRRRKCFTRLARPDHSKKTNDPKLRSLAISLDLWIYIDEVFDTTVDVCSGSYIDHSAFLR